MVPSGAVTVLTPAGERDPAQPTPVGAPGVEVWRRDAARAPAVEAVDAPGDGRRPRLAPAARVPALLLVLVVAAWGLWSFFGPVWYGVPLERDVLEWRWWFESWV